MEKIITLQNSKIAKVPGLTALAEKIMFLPEINAICKKIPNPNTIPMIIDYFLDAIDLKLAYEKSDLISIPKEGPLLIVANHPFGGLEGLIMAKILLQIRPDVKILANYLLKHVHQLDHLFIGVDPFRIKKAKNFLGLREANDWLADGHALGTFPSGTVSHWQWQHRKVIDPDWHYSIARFAEINQATVLPLFFAGNNSWYFQLAGFITSYLRSILLPQQLFAKKHQTIHFKFGEPILFSDLEKISSTHQKIRYLQKRTYLLGYRSKKPFSLKRKQQALQAEQCKNLMAAEIKKLAPERCLVDQEDYSVFLVPASDIPSIMPQIGVLREQAFRSIGEGTGRAIDLDEFDPYYQQLFAWHKSEKKIMGAYRFGLTDVIFPQFGKEKLYVAKIYDLSTEFFQRIEPAIEVGRSFVTQEYQKNTTALLLLWKGITRFITKNSQYQSLYGLISISQLYEKISRDMILNFIKQHHYDHELAQLVKAKSPYHSAKLSVFFKELMTNCHSINDLSNLISNIEYDKKGVPVLLKQYLNIQGKIFGFNLDKEFGDCLDCLFISMIKDIPPKILAYLNR